MLKPNKRWHLQEVDAKDVERIAKTNNIDPIVAKLLALRGITEADEIKRFLKQDLTSFHDPFLLSDMKKAVERIQTAIVKNERILIYGDYDADGVTSTSLLYKTLKLLNANFAYYIPNRFTEGYGLNQEAIEQAGEKGFRVIVTVDTGVSAVNEAKIACDLGIDLIITDHHEPPEVLPDAYALINPKKPSDTYPFKQLAGVGIAFKLAHALLGRIPLDLLDIAAIGTIADLVPLVDENRLIASLGLKQMKETKHLGLSAMLKATGLIDKEITAGHIGFIIGPRINASGRLDTAGHAVRLFISDNGEEVEALAEQLNEINKERQELVEQITEAALNQIDSDGLASDNVLIVAGKNWNVGVIGIVASRLLEKYYRPTIVLSIDPETMTAKGSARSIVGYDIYKALTAVNDLLPHYGGHPAAAGMSLAADDIVELRERLNKLATEWLTDDDYIPLVKVDTVCNLKDITVELVEQVEQLAPFGMGNTSPRFLINTANVQDIRVIGKEKQHLKLFVEDNEKKIEAIAFQMGHLNKEIAHNSNIELLGEIGINEWNNERKPQLLVKDLQVSTVQVFDWRNSKNKDLLTEFNSSELAIIDNYDQVDLDQDSRILVLKNIPPSLEVLTNLLKKMKKLERIYCLYGNNDKNEPIEVINRKIFKEVYISLRQNSSLRNKQKIEQYFKNLGKSSEMIQLILDIFTELGFIIIEGNLINLVPNPQKKDLTDSLLYQKYLEREKVKELFLYADTTVLKKWFLDQLNT